ncbi:MAG: polyphosphate polymerase domain-containing protein [Clostridia bacterium]|nr:polyphosphate polymerase domain-containing protein [Clostridia bacterium]
MYRHELKYMVNHGEAQVIKSRLKTICKPDQYADENGRYTVTSLYFDDFCDSAINDNLSGSLKRKKFRIRIYNGKDSIIRLERKVKNDNGGCKHSVILTKEQYLRILQGNYVLFKDSDDEVLSEFYNFSSTRLLQPKVIVEYDREAFICSNGDVRITFDSNIRLPVGSKDILNNTTISAQVIRPQETIMEVKYTGFLPSHIKKIIQNGKSNQQAFSKYVACRTFIN